MFAPFHGILMNYSCLKRRNTINNIIDELGSIYYFVTNHVSYSVKLRLRVLPLTRYEICMRV